MISLDTCWDTAHELAFLNGIGGWSSPAGRAFPPTRRRRLLSAYIAVASLRRDWGRVDRQRCVARAAEDLERLASIDERA